MGKGIYYLGVYQFSWEKSNHLWTICMVGEQKKKKIVNFGLNLFYSIFIFFFLI